MVNANHAKLLVQLVRTNQFALLAQWVSLSMVNVQVRVPLRLIKIPLAICVVLAIKIVPPV